MGKLTRAQAEQIAKTKMPDLTAADLEAAVRTVAGSARSMGVEVEGSDMAHISKRTKKLRAKIDRDKTYPIVDAIKLVKEGATAKFNESIDVAINLGIDAKKSDQTVRGSIVLPKGTGKTVRVAVFAQGDKAQAAKDAGADIVGFEDLAAQVKEGKIDFDVAIATPDAMRVVGQLGQILGPRGLMPNPKVGTVTPNVAEAVKNAKAGQVQFRADKAGIVQCTIGRASFTEDALKENFLALIDAVNKARPTGTRASISRKFRSPAPWVRACGWTRQAWPQQ